MGLNILGVDIMMFVKGFDMRQLVSDALGRRDYVYYGSVCIPSKPAVVLYPGTPVLLPHKIQTPNVTLARKFVTGVRSETHI